MINDIKGVIDCVLDSSIIVECGGIGYQVFVSNSTISNLTNDKDNVKIFTYMCVKEDGITLYGFLTAEEQSVFNLLITVSGVGPKVALSVLNVLKPNEIFLAILTNDTQTLGKAQGIGKKTAERLVLELKDRVKTNEALENFTSPQQTLKKSTTQSSSIKQDSIDALLSLGYTRSEVVKAVFEIYTEGAKTEQVIKQALKQLSKGNL